jgi:hypothetical protein
MVHAGSMQEQKGAVALGAFPDFGQEDCGPVLDEAPFAQLCRGGHGILKKRRAATLAALSFSKPRPVQLADGATLGPAAAEVKAESGAKAARFRQENGRTPFRKGNKQKAAVPKGGG